MGFSLKLSVFGFGFRVFGLYTALRTRDTACFELGAPPVS